MGEIVCSNDFSRYSSVMASAMTLPLLGLTTCLGTGAIACDRRDLAGAKSRGND
ncbi:hypothetical protein [Oscillatoria acuminata]|uniref:hypothetical protein n=1 Tax=Oscillatoria acuminata TaxID=118323 RepID=UPI0018DB0FE7|nr:hypothetical protein [Oscillatoria acuminata]